MAAAAVPLLRLRLRLRLPLGALLFLLQFYILSGGGDLSRCRPGVALWVSVWVFPAGRPTGVPQQLPACFIPLAFRYFNELKLAEVFY
ncbi:hypothetical protein CB1_002565001 [Camelus ferus]|nr:hypothetical protein CB1_002565001 [Camelus ferus]